MLILRTLALALGIPLVVAMCVGLSAMLNGDWAPDDTPLGRVLYYICLIGPGLLALVLWIKFCAWIVRMVWGGGA